MDNDLRMVELRFTSDEAHKFVEVLEWARQTPDPKITDRTFASSTLEGILDDMDKAIALGVTMDYCVRLQCRNVDDAAYAMLRWGKAEEK